MAFRDFQEREQGVQLLQRSLARGRLGHAYLFTGQQLDELEALARTLAKTLNCQHPVRPAPDAPATDCCDACLVCRKIDGENHGDVHWVRPESKSRVITIEQIRELSREVYLKPNEAEFKVAVVVAADRLNPQAANAFLKTLEEPPPKSVLILLTSDPSRLLETIVSRCLRLSFGGAGVRRLDAAMADWLTRFSDLAATEQKSLLSRYRLMDALLRRLAEMKAEIEKRLSERSPLERYEDADKDLRDKWEDELAAAIEAEYRRRRSELLLAVQWWLRDVWLHCLRPTQEGLSFPQLAGTPRLAQRLTPRQAIENLRTIEATQRLLHTNVQEPLALEVGLLKLHL
ncbi:MAG TPA: DNA polymerase III subunit [Verrucomicrobiae bacterium]